jgi:hypothetical protein
MNTFQDYLSEINKVYEFRVKFACDVKDKIETIKHALDAYQLESFSTGKRLPIQEYAEFPQSGAAEVTMYEVALGYPTTPPQLQQVISERAHISKSFVSVRTKLDDMNRESAEPIPRAEPALLTPDLEDAPGAQELAGQKRVTSLFKELSARTYEIAGKDTTLGGEKDPSYGKTTNDSEPATTSPVGTKQNKIPSPVKGKK